MTVEVSVCICTFRRPALLDALLGVLAAQRQEDAAVEFVVVDNDPAGSARAVLDAWAQRLPLRRVHLPRPNIAAARNAAVAAARGMWIAFIDDDEQPDPGWLAALRRCQQVHAADAVFGPVVPRHVPGTPAWLVRGGFFDRPRHPTGTPIGTGEARTGNVLLRRADLQSVAAAAGREGPFDEAFGRTGAEDTVLFHALHARGARFVWCDEASVQEEVPAARANVGWLLRRSYRLGQTYVLSELVRRRGAARLARGAWLAMRALAQAGVALLLAIAWLPLSRIRAMRWLRALAAQAGKLSALSGHRYHEYGD
ncbi:glycosyltransferase family 2 protein [Xylophilus sp.]|uniref:glycosyltransferase family 2 protein n=1 Tax=Xylophilus sp. TaxID=2653893 RepID=UPI0013B877EC|nr:glycosyltransferase [Xylophilus sp.]KAF1045986.1 MAG: hypothetical protein GAK38_02689 [Xylophilus sp.]